MDNTEKQAPARGKERAVPQTDESASAKEEAATARAKSKLEAGTKTKPAAKTKAEKKPETKAKDAVQAKTPGAPLFKPERASMGKVAQDASMKAKEKTVAGVKATLAPAAPLARPAQAARTKAEPARIVEPENAPQIETETATLAEATASLGQAAPVVEPAQPALVEAMEAHIVELEPANSAAPKQQPWTNSEAEFESADIQKIGEKLSEPEKIVPEKSVTIFVADFDSIAAELINYSKKSFENGGAVVEQLLAAKSFESAIQIGSDFVQRSCMDFVAYLTNIAAMYAKLAGEALTQPNFPHAGTNMGLIFQLVRKRSP